MIRQFLAHAKLKAVVARVERRHIGAAQLAEDHAGDTDGSGADDENALSHADHAAPHGVRADRQEFDHRRLIHRHAVGDDEIVLGHAEIIRHAAVGVDAEDAEFLTAIGFSAPAGDALAAGDVGDDRDLLPRLEGAAQRSGFDIASEFVPDDSRIFEIRLRAVKDVQIGAADAGAGDAHEDFASLGDRVRSLDDFKRAGTFAEEGFHCGRPRRPTLPILSLTDMLAPPCKIISPSPRKNRIRRAIIWQRHLPQIVKLF